MVIGAGDLDEKSSGRPWAVSPDGWMRAERCGTGCVQVCPAGWC